MSRQRHPEVVAMGTRLKDMREELRISRLDMAARLNLTEEGYGNYERGVSRIVLTDLPRIAQALGVSNRALLMRVGLLPVELTTESDNAEIADEDLGRRLAPILESWQDADERGRTDAATTLEAAVGILRRARQSRTIAKKHYGNMTFGVVQRCAIMATA